LGHHGGVEIDPVPVIVVTGTIGAGKTAVALEMAVILREHRIPHAMADLDALSECWPVPDDDPSNVGVTLCNLAAAWANYRDAGAQRLVVAGVIEGRDDLDRIRASIPGAEVTVCRLTASPAVLRKRIVGRAVGSGVEWDLARAPELDAVLDALDVVVLRLTNEAKTVREVAMELLDAAAWLR
jgi:adenylylsulfate kinase